MEPVPSCYSLVPEIRRVAVWATAASDHMASPSGRDGRDDAVPQRLRIIDLAEFVHVGMLARLVNRGMAYGRVADNSPHIIRAHPRSAHDERLARHAASARGLECAGQGRREALEPET